MATATLKLTERELWLLMNGFGASFVSDGSEDGNELDAISRKVAKAWEKAWEKARAGRAALAAPSASVQGGEL